MIGPNADDRMRSWETGPGPPTKSTSSPTPRHLTTTVLDGFRAIVPGDWTVTHARGADIGHEIPDPAGPTLIDGQPHPKLFIPAGSDEAMLDEAVPRPGMSPSRRRHRRNRLLIQSELSALPNRPGGRSETC